MPNQVEPLTNRFPGKFPPAVRQSLNESFPEPVLPSTTDVSAPEVDTQAPPSIAETARQFIRATGILPADRSAGTGPLQKRSLRQFAERHSTNLRISEQQVPIGIGPFRRSITQVVPRAFAYRGVDDNGNLLAGGLHTREVPFEEFIQNPWDYDPDTYNAAWVYYHLATTDGNRLRSLGVLNTAILQKRRILSQIKDPYERLRKALMYVFETERHNRKSDEQLERIASGERTRRIIETASPTDEMKELGFSVMEVRGVKRIVLRSNLPASIASLTDFASWGRRIMLYENGVIFESRGENEGEENELDLKWNDLFDRAYWFALNNPPWLDSLFGFLQKVRRYPMAPVSALALKQRGAQGFVTQMSIFHPKRTQEFMNQIIADMYFANLTSMLEPREPFHLGDLINIADPEGKPFGALPYDPNSADGLAQKHRAVWEGLDELQEIQRQTKECRRQILEQGGEVPDEIDPPFFWPPLPYSS